MKNLKRWILISDKIIPSQTDETVAYILKISKQLEHSWIGPVSFDSGFKFAELCLLYFFSWHSLPDSCCTTPGCHKPLQEILSSRLLGDAQQRWSWGTLRPLDGPILSGGLSARARGKSHLFAMSKTPWQGVSLVVTKVVKSFPWNLSYVLPQPVPSAITLVAITLVHYILLNTNVY